MAYQVLARKWRPKTFTDLVGQEHVVKALQNALDKGRLHHAYLLTGTRGVGKTTIARILAKSLNCSQPQHGEPCGECQSCRDIDQGRFIDLLEIDAASNTGIDNIREVLENAQYAPTAGKYKVYIIDEVHMLSKSAFNAMLKTLEEPPEHVKFILATTDPHKVPVTVLSRCLQFVLRNMTPRQVADHLAHVLIAEQIPYEAPALALLGRAAAGSMRDALSLLDQAIALGSGSVNEADVRQMIGAVDQHCLYALLQAVIRQDGTALMASAQELAGHAIGFDSTLNELALLLQKLALLKSIPAAIPSDDPEYDILQQLAAQLNEEQIQLYYQCIIHGKQDLPLAPDEYAGFVMTLLRLLAFAPLAAGSIPSGSRISGTELRDPAPSAKPDSNLPERLAEATEPSAHCSAPDFQVAPTSRPATESASHDTTVHELSDSAATPTVRQHNTTGLTTGNADTLPTATDSADSHKSSPAGLANTVPSSKNAAEPAPSVSLPAAAGTIPPAGFEGAPAAGHAEPAPDKRLPETQTAATEQTHSGLPLPTADTWPDIVAALAPKIGAARMSALHTACISFDPTQNILTLAVADAGQVSINREHIQRIEKQLSAGYGRPLSIRTIDWPADNNAPETPAMRQQRLKLADRQQAQALLEKDPTAQDILSLFGARWLPESLVLQEPDPT